MVLPVAEAIAGLYIFAVVLSVPVGTEYIQTRICSESYGHADPAFCRSAEVTSQAAEWMQNTGLVTGITSLLVAACMGGWSDSHYGRKPAMLLALVGSCVAGLVTCAIYIYTLPLEFLYVPAAIAGLTGHYPLMLMACFATLIDTTALEMRTRRIAFLEGAIYLGIIVASFISGPLLARCGYTGAQLVILGLVAVAFLVALPLRESWTPDRKGRLLPNPFRPLLVLNRNWNLRLVAVCFLLTLVSFTGTPVIAIVFTSHEYGWDPTTIGYWLALDKVTRSLALFVVIPCLKRCVPNSRIASDVVLVRVSTAASVATYLVYGAVHSPVAMFAGTALGPLSGAAVPVLRSLASKSCSASEQGSIMAAMAVTESLAGIIGERVQLTRAFAHLQPG